MYVIDFPKLLIGESWTGQSYTLYAVNRCEHFIYRWYPQLPHHNYLFWFALVTPFAYQPSLTQTFAAVGGVADPNCRPVPTQVFGGSSDYPQKY